MRDCKLNQRDKWNRLSNNNVKTYQAERINGKYNKWIGTPLFIKNKLEFIFILFINSNLFLCNKKFINILYMNSHSYEHLFTCSYERYV